MSEMEKQKFEEVICAMSEEEMKLAASKIEYDILWDELRKRATEAMQFKYRIEEMVANR